MDMPRDRTQSGRFICMVTLRVLAVVIQAAPPRNMAGTASQGEVTTAITAIEAACSAAPRKTRPSRL